MEGLLDQVLRKISLEVNHASKELAIAKHHPGLTSRLHIGRLLYDTSCVEDLE